MAETYQQNIESEMHIQQISLYESRAQTYYYCS